MKYLLMTAPNNGGISEVFYTLLAPIGVAPQSLITRWDSLVENSPIMVVSASGQEEVGLNYKWDSSSETFGLNGENNNQVLKPTDRESYAFLVNNNVVSIMHLNGEEEGDARFAVAFSEPVTIKSVPDNSDVSLGYTWDGTDFTSPEN